MLRAVSRAVVAAWLPTCGCTGDLLHSTAWSSACDRGTEACESASRGGGGGGGGGVDNAGGAGASGAGTSAGGDTSSSSVGGAPVPECGNGTVESGEECDTGQPTAGVCEGCTILCADDEQKDPTGLHCYRFVSVAAAGATWSAASVACADSGGHLATIGSAEEQAFVEPLVVGEFAWIGASDQAARGTFVWVTGEPFDYVNWKPDQPDDANGLEDCVHIDALQLHLWNDLPCDQLRGYLCERDPL